MNLSAHPFRSLLTLLLLISASFSVSALSPAPTSRPQHPEGRQSVGLVLSGGGAKGIAHIGVIQALEEHGVPIDYITGTSMGAIVGGLYAAGYTPAEMMDLIESRAFSYWSTGTIDQRLTYYYSQPAPTPALATINFSDLAHGGKLKPLLPTSLINPLPMNFAFMELFSPYTAQCGGDFDRLFVPLRTVTSDVYTKHKVVCRSGSLGDAVRASMSFPIVFKPTELDSTLMFDGGIYDNFPVDVMREDFNPNIMIGVDVSNPDTKPRTGDVMQQLEDMIIQNNDYSLPADWGIKIKVDVSHYSLLDFGKAREIYQAGYDRAMEMMDSLLIRVTAREKAGVRDSARTVFKSHTPKLIFDSVNVVGGTPVQNDYIKYLFTRNSPDTFGIPRARESFYQAVTSGKVADFMPKATFNPIDSLFTLNLSGSMKNRFTASAGGFISTGTSSMFYLGAGYSTLSLHALNASLQAWAGQSYLALAGSAQIQMLTMTPGSFRIEGVMSRQKFQQSDVLFFKDKAPAFVIHHEGFGRLSYLMAAGRHGRLDFGIAGGRLDDRYYPVNIDNISDISRDRAIQDMGVLHAGYSRSTLDNENFPTRGAYVDVILSGIASRSVFTPGNDSVSDRSVSHPLYGRLKVTTRNYFPVYHRLSLGIETEILSSTRKLSHNYSQAVVEASAFNPTPSSYNAFNPSFRANSYLTVGVVPVWTIGQLLQLRGRAHLFLPARPIRDNNGIAEYGPWFTSPQFFGEAAAVVTLPFAEVKAYANYLTAPHGNWNLGISLGMFIQAPKLIR